MIQKMKKITLLALEVHRQEMLDQLSELSMMHISIDRKKAGQGEAAMYLQKLEQISRVQFILEEYKETELEQKECSAEECIAEVFDTLAKSDSLKKQLDDLNQKQAKLAPWGDFEPASLKSIRDQGLFVKFWTVSAKEKLNPPEGMVLQTISTDAGNKCILSIAQEDSSLPTAQEVKSVCGA